MASFLLDNKKHKKRTLIQNNAIDGLSIGYTEIDDYSFDKQCTNYQNCLFRILFCDVCDESNAIK